MIVVITPVGQIGRQVLGNMRESAEAIRMIARSLRLAPGVRERVEVVLASPSCRPPTGMKPGNCYFPANEML